MKRTIRSTAGTRCAQIASFTGGEAASITRHRTPCVFRTEMLPPVGAVK